MICLFLSLKNVYYSYEKKEFNPAIKNISIDLSLDSFTAIIGSNGSGKTTIGKIMAGILKPNKGTVYIGNDNLNQLSLGSIGKRIGYIFQDPERQIFASTVEEELSFVLKIKGIEENQIRLKTEEMLNKFRLSHLRNRFPFYLSRGEKQRLALAAVLINEPKFLILDEPTTALDLKRKSELKFIIKGLLNDGVGMLVISHDNGFIDSFAQRIIEVNGGEICFDSLSKN